MIDFNDGFETGDTSAFDSVVATGGTVTVEGTSPIFGSKSLKCVTVAGADPLQKRAAVTKNFAGVNLRHLRAYVRLAASTVGPGKRVTFLCIYPATAPSDYFATITLLDTKLVVYFRDGAGYKIADPNIVFEHGKAHLLELRVKVGAGDGEISAWLNGAQIVNMANVDNSPFGSITHIRSGLVFCDSETSQSLEVDEVASGDEYIGPIKPPTPCFIATAAFGSPMEPQIDTLRAFRDSFLPDRVVGAYYRFSPRVADYLRQHAKVRVSVREATRAIIKLLRSLHVSH